ncbi:MAG: hypothetical protein LBT96_01455 [Campylobacteraceae bacterium]|jgi:Ser-tRNA(Ala) deacylase AlaX|nr:hypothetical protein [Campylobacteraceae bacterium]
MYLAKCEAVITAAREDGIITDKTVAFAEGGGKGIERMIVVVWDESLHVRDYTF